MLNKKQLTDLRGQIVLCSLYYNDYANNLGIDEKTCCNFFDGYADYLADLMADDGHTDADFFNVLEQYDTPGNLWDYYAYYLDYDALPRHTTKQYFLEV